MHTYIQSFCLYVLRVERTTPSIPYRVKKVLILVLDFRFTTGRMSLRLKTGVKAFSSAGWFGSEQFCSMAPHTADERIFKTGKLSFQVVSFPAKHQI